LPQGPYQRKRADRPAILQKAPKSAWSGRGRLLEGQLRPDPVPHFLAERPHLPILAANSSATLWAPLGDRRLHQGRVKHNMF
jgi:hypothetical protein